MNYELYMKKLIQIFSFQLYWRVLLLTGKGLKGIPKSIELPLRVVLIYLIGCLWFSLGGCSPKKSPTPNIILISFDDLGWSDLGCYGSEISTPNIDSLAYNGLRFTSFYNTAKCFPSRACLITGVYAQDCGYHQTFTNPISQAVTLGEVLRAAGYSTYWSGKHHGLENPYDRGFDRYFGLKDGASNHFNPGRQRVGEPKPAQKKNDREWGIDSVIHQPYTPTEKDFYSTDYFTNYAIKYLDRSKESHQPFFLYLAYTAPHDPLMAWPEDIKKYHGMYDQGYEHVRRHRYGKQMKMGLIDSTFKLSAPAYTPWDSLSIEQRTFEAQKMEVYAAMIDRIDQNIGRLLRHLSDIGLADNTLIMLVSDNGASAEVVDLSTDNDLAPIGSMGRWVSLGENWANVANTPFRYYKNHSFEGGVNTPAIVYWPGVIEPNSITRYPGHFIDIMATLVELSGANYPEVHNNASVTSIRGKSLLPVFAKARTERDGPLFWEWRGGQAMRLNQWKIVRNRPDEPWQLYRILEDPTEIDDMAHGYEDLVHRLDSLYYSWYSKYY